MANYNKHGLSRDIPEQVKREVRQRCGFGCIICGYAMCQYEHVDPKFHEAEEHIADCIVLLCATCHDSVTRGMLSKDTVKVKSKTPKCKEQGFSFGAFDIGTTSPEIIIGTMKAKNAETFYINIYGDEIFSVQSPSILGQPFLISAKLCDRDGKEILRIKDNIWETSSANWDVEVIGSRIIIRKKLGDIVLALRSEPPDRLVVERLYMVYRGVQIRTKEDEDLEIETFIGQIIKSPGIEFHNGKGGIEFTKDGAITMGSGGQGGTVMVKGGTTFKNGAPLEETQSKKAKQERNFPCSCGSGIKYKYCCGNKNKKI